MYYAVEARICVLGGGGTSRKKTLTNVCVFSKIDLRDTSAVTPYHKSIFTMRSKDATNSNVDLRDTPAVTPHHRNVYNTI